MPFIFNKEQHVEVRLSDYMSVNINLSNYKHKEKSSLHLTKNAYIILLYVNFKMNALKRKKIMNKLKLNKDFFKGCDTNKIIKICCTICSKPINCYSLYYRIEYYNIFCEIRIIFPYIKLQFKRDMYMIRENDLRID